MNQKFMLESPKLADITKKIMRANTIYLSLNSQSIRKGISLDISDKNKHNHLSYEIGTKLCLPNEKDFNVYFLNDLLFNFEHFYKNKYCIILFKYCYSFYDH